MFSNYHLTNPAIIIIALVLLASVFSVYFCIRHKSKLTISWTVVTVVALLLPIILMFSNFLDYQAVGKPKSVVVGLFLSNQLVGAEVPHYNIFGWMTTVAGSGADLSPDELLTHISIGGIIAISCASAVALASIALTVVLLVKFRSLKLSKLSMVGAFLAVTIIVFVILFIFAGPTLQINNLTDEHKLFSFWTFTYSHKKP